MLVHLVTNGASGKGTMANAGSMQRGIDVQAQSSLTHWEQKINALVKFKHNPSEADVHKSAEMAGNLSIARTLYQDKINYDLESIGHYASMYQTELNAMGRVAGISAQVAQSQENMIRQFGQAAYTIGKGAAYTKGITNAYAQGLSQMDRAM